MEIISHDHAGHKYLVRRIGEPKTAQWIFATNPEQAIRIYGYRYPEE